MPDGTPKKKTPLDIKSLCRVYTEGNIRTLAGLASGVNVAPDIQLRAIAMLLERGWGRPQQDVKADAEIRVTIRKMIDGTND